jgi:hypothetical protein
LQQEENTFFIKNLGEEEKRDLNPKKRQIGVKILLNL